MAVLLVAMSIMAVMMTVAMPVWKQMSQREKEEELIFRGQQYARAIGLFQRKYANASPPNLDVLVEQRFLRKKYKDPITQSDFLPIRSGQGAPGVTPQTGSQGGRPGAAIVNAPSPGQSTSTVSSIGTPGAGATGGIIGVASQSKDKSIRIYNGRTHYHEWAFVYTSPVQAPGAGAPGTTAPGQRSGQPQRGPQGQPGAGPSPLGLPRPPEAPRPSGSPRPPSSGNTGPFSPR